MNMKKISLILFSLAVLFCGKNFSQITFPANGAPNKNHNVYVFKNCSLHVDYKTIIPNAILVVKDGIIIDAGEKVIEPAAAVVYDLKGKHIYPAFIDIYSDYGMPDVKAPAKNSMAPQMESSQKGAYGWNMAVKPETEAIKLFAHDQRAADELRRLGFGAVLTSQKDGIVRGSAGLVTLATAKENECIVKDKAASLFSFRKGVSPQDFPESLTGSIALLRQTYLDAQWYALLPDKKEYNITLDAFNQLQNLPQIFETTDKLSVLRADKLGDEFKVNYIMKGSGNEYQRIIDMQETRCKFILPLNFPDAFDVEDPFDAELVTLTDLKHWEMAPVNPGAFEKYLIDFSLTLSGLKDKKSFYKNLRKALEYGLTEEGALKALTWNPASFLGAQDKIGSLKKGMLANFFIANKNLFEEGSTIHETWVNGIQNKFSDMNAPDISGKYELNTSEGNFSFSIKQNDEKFSGSIVLKDTTKTSATIAFKQNLISIYYAVDSVNTVRISGSYNEDTKSFSGKGQKGNGNWFDWSMGKTEDLKKEEAKKTERKTPQIGNLIYPFCAYGKKWEEENIKQRFKNRLGAILIKDATVWTNEAEGILKEYDVYVVDGKIVRINDNIDAPALAYAKVINGKGMHLTAGIIDEHSHIALSEGVNEGTQASSAEVRMADVINSEDINIYRQLAGGVTACQLLHGSANPIGGQSGLIKLRWGLNPEQMKIEKADGFIKFALGENVKQSNWGDFSTVRFPQSRMGVEQVYYDFFTRAKEYNSKWKAFNTLSEKDKKTAIAPRKDIELEAIAEILDKKRFITCHSYVQSEINMLMHVGDSMGFTVNTFTHILEGYKVADKMKARNISASTFADWWAYKMEVMDAIPYNAALMTKVGINTSVNSDDAEMGRRLNQEAAKAIKYGGLSEEEALKLCTLNPAKMLHLDNRMGSIKVGKDADLVLWTDNPLSIYAKVNKTIVDGIVYFDAKEDSLSREEIKTERARIINKMILAKKGGEPTQKPKRQRHNLYHCDTVGMLEEQ
jgi:imidazolonepropionase-like amidohydrolase